MNDCPGLYPVLHLYGALEGNVGALVSTCTTPLVEAFTLISNGRLWAREQAMKANRARVKQ